MSDTRKYKGVKFLNFQYPGQDKKTIYEFETWSEANKMIRGYLLAYRTALRNGASLWISQRPCKGWYDE